MPVANEQQLRKSIRQIKRAFDSSIPESERGPSERSQAKEATLISNAFAGVENDLSQGARAIEIVLSGEALPNDQLKTYREDAERVVSASEGDSSSPYYDEVKVMQRHFGTDEVILPRDFLLKFFNAPAWLVGLPVSYVGLHVGLRPGTAPMEQGASSSAAPAVAAPATEPAGAPGMSQGAQSTERPHIGQPASAAPARPFVNPPAPAPAAPSRGNMPSRSDAERRLAAQEAAEAARDAREAATERMLDAERESAAAPVTVRGTLSAADDSRPEPTAKGLKGALGSGKRKKGRAPGGFGSLEDGDDEIVAAPASAPPAKKKRTVLVVGLAAAALFALMMFPVVFAGASKGQSAETYDKDKTTIIAQIPSLDCTSRADAASKTVVKKGMSASSAHVFYTGDSRTVQMQNVVASGTKLTETNSISVHGNETWYAKNGMNLEWFKSTAVPNIETSLADGDIVVIMFGVNDLGNGHAYADYISRKAADWAGRGITTYFVSVNPVNPDKPGSVTSTTNQQVESFNATVKDELAGVRWIETYATLAGSIDWNQSDGLHYGAEDYKRIYNAIQTAINTSVSTPTTAVLLQEDCNGSYGIASKDGSVVSGDLLHGSAYHQTQPSVEASGATAFAMGVNALLGANKYPDGYAVWAGPGFNSDSVYDVGGKGASWLEFNGLGGVIGSEMIDGDVQTTAKLKEELQAGHVVIMASGAGSEYFANDGTSSPGGDGQYLMFYKYHNGCYYANDPSKSAARGAGVAYTESQMANWISGRSYHNASRLYLLR